MKLGFVFGSTEEKGRKREAEMVCVRKRIVRLIDVNASVSFPLEQKRKKAEQPVAEIYQGI